MFESRKKEEKIKFEKCLLKAKEENKKHNSKFKI